MIVHFELVKNNIWAKLMPLLYYPTPSFTGNVNKRETGVGQTPKECVCEKGVFRRKKDHNDSV